MTGVYTWSTTASENISANTGIVWDTGMAPVTVRTSSRQVMTDVRSLANDLPWFQYGIGSKDVRPTYNSSTSVKFSGGDATAYWHAGRRVKAVGTSTGTIYGKVSSSSYSAPDTTVNFTWDSGSLSNEALSIYAGAPITGRPVGFGLTAGSILFSGPGGYPTEDNANLFWDDSNNRLGLGVAAPQSSFEINFSGATAPAPLTSADVHLASAVAGTTFLLDLAAGTPAFVGRRTNTSFGSPSAIVINNVIGALHGRGYDGSSLSNTQGAIEFFAAEGWGTSAHGTSARIRTTPAGSTTLTTTHVFNSDGSMSCTAGLTTGSTTLHTTSVSLTNGAGALTGTLTNAPATGNPTKWIPINDNGTTRYIPAW